MFIYLVVTWFTLLGIYIYIEKMGIDIFHKEKIVKKISIEEAQYKIDALLKNYPIVFPKNISTFENNQSYTKKNQQTLNRVVVLLKSVNNNIFIKISSHTNLNGKRGKNRILSQKRANTILEFIKKEYPTDTIDAIGYGEEFPLHKDENAKDNSRTEIKLEPLVPKI